VNQCAQTQSIKNAARPLNERQARVLESSPIPAMAEAVEYDGLIRSHTRLLNQPFVNMLSKTGLRRGRVLDVGTGPGWIPIELALRHPEWEISAVDPSEDMLTLARRHAQDAGVSHRIRFIHGDAAALPFERGEFDLVFSRFTLHHLPRPETLFDGCAHVTRGGGRILIKDMLRQPAWKTALLSLVNKYVFGYSKLKTKMFQESVNAALTYSELRTALRSSRLSMANVHRFRGLYFIVTA
jgi:ubiquinone/menaquinone biosynthesis C-methylase UbiE